MNYKASQNSIIVILIVEAKCNDWKYIQKIILINVQIVKFIALCLEVTVHKAKLASLKNQLFMTFPNDS